MRTSTLCIVALACLMAQFTNAMPLNLKRGTELGSFAGKDSEGDASTVGAVYSGTEDSPKAGTLTGASPNFSASDSAAEAGPDGFAVHKDINTGKVAAGPLSATGALAGAAAVDKNGAAGAVGESAAIGAKGVGSVSESQDVGASVKSDLSEASAGTAGGAAVKVDPLGTVEFQDQIKVTHDENHIAKPEVAGSIKFVPSEDGLL